MTLAQTVNKRSKYKLNIILLLYLSPHLARPTRRQHACVVINKSTFTYLIKLKCLFLLFYVVDFLFYKITDSPIIFSVSLYIKILQTIVFILKFKRVR